MTMLKNYMKVFFRAMRRQKLHSLVTISGLSIGLAGILLVMLYIQAELSFEKCHEKRERLHRVISQTSSANENTVTAWATPLPLGPTLKSDYPEVVNFARFYGPLWNDVKIGNNLFTEKFVAAVDPSFFKMFSFHFLQGNPETALPDPDSVVLTDETAKRYFGQEDPIGKTFFVNRMQARVTAVVRIPSRTHLRFTMARPLQVQLRDWEGDPERWTNAVAFGTYIELRAGVSLREFNQKIGSIIKKYDPTIPTMVYLQRLSRVHLHSAFADDYQNLNKGNITFLYVLAAAAGCLLLMACMNFVNLSLANSHQRAKEIGVRKVHGARRGNLARQFLAETLFYSFLSLLVAVELVSLFLPTFDRLSQRQIVMADLLGLLPLFGLLSIVLLTGLLAGAYPALFLSALSPQQAIKGTFQVGAASRGTVRKFLVITQLTIVLVLLIGTVVIYGQLRYMQTKDLGLNTDHVLIFGRLNKIRDIEAFRNELRRNPHIVGFTQSQGPTAGFEPSSDVDWDGKNPAEIVTLYQCGVDHSYLDVFKIRLAAGRFFSKDITTDQSNFLLNETALKVTGINSPLGKRFSLNGKTGQIIGVLKDFHTEIPKTPIPPLVFQYHPNYGMMYVKTDGYDPAGTISFIRALWEKNMPQDYAFEYRFVDDELKEYYEDDVRLKRIFTDITLLTLVVAGIGLFGLSSDLAEQRTKEIGIRKVLGCSVRECTFLLSREFAKWAVIANVISWPIAYLIMRRWLQGFAYRMELGWEVFALAALGTAVLVLVTVCLKAIKIASSNPVDSLRYE
jgi:putative ABC transport system permease protein